MSSVFSLILNIHIVKQWRIDKQMLVLTLYFEFAVSKE